MRRGERGKIKKKYGGRLKSYTKNGLSKYDNTYWLKSKLCILIFLHFSC